MTNPIPVPDSPNETLNPNASEQCQVKEKEDEAPPTPHLDPQSPKTLTLPDQNPPIQNDPVSPNPNQDEDTLMEDPTQTQIVDDAEPDAPAAAATAARRAPKRKKMGPKRTALEKKSREKFQVIVETLKPIPFIPAKALDFESHRSLLQRLGLWEFVHIEFDSALRGDLLAQLIASYVPNMRGSYVNGLKINVNRADLGRALKLPKKFSVSAVAIDEDGAEMLDSGKSIAFLEELVSNWMLLHDDTYIMPSEVLGILKLIKEGSFEKVDWAGLIWAMVEKELKAPQLVNCYYASHLQHLIKTQHEELLKAPEEEAEVKDEGEEVEGEETEVKGEGEDEGEGEEVEAKVEEEEDEEEEDAVGEEVDGCGDVRMGGVEEGRLHDLEEHNIELSLGQDNVERVEVEKVQDGGEQMMDFEHSKEEEHGMWLLDPKNSGEEPFLRPCHTSDVKGMDCDQAEEVEVEGGDGQELEEEDEDAEEDEHEGGFHLSPKSMPLEGMPSGPGSLIQAMEAVQMPFGSGIGLRDNPVGEFLSSRDESQMISGSSLFGNGHKRDISLDNHDPHHSLNGSNKRLRSDSPWNSKPADFDMCMEQIEHWMGKARMAHASKNQVIEDSSMNQQLLLNELQKRDNMIAHLHKAKMEEVYRLEKELYMMQSLADGYRKALKETQKAFAEYRAICPQADEPLYKDVPGSGGLVLSVMELEKERLKKEEEERTKMREFQRDFEKKLRDIDGTWMGIMEGHQNRIESLDNRLLANVAQVKYLKEVKAKGMISDPVECPSTTEGQTA